ncbi:hypothetical protein ACFLXY_02205 [Chloroflexota bacterium]
MDTKSPEYREAFELLKRIAEGPRDTSFPDKDTLQADLDRLVERSRDLCLDMENTLTSRNPGNSRSIHFSSSYQRWYSEASEFLHQVLPSRLDEFKFLYRGDPKRKAVTTETFSIRDFLLGICPYTRGAEIKSCADVALEKLRMQAQILESARVRFESSLANLDISMLNDTADARTRVRDQAHRDSFFEGAMTVSRVINSFFWVFDPEESSDDIPGLPSGSPTLSLRDSASILSHMSETNREAEP